MDNVLFYPENNDKNKITVLSEINKSITENYAPQRLKDGNFYARRRGGRPMTLFDCWSYKCAEYGAAQFLHDKFNLPLVLPDVNIYKSSKKSWSPDFVYENVTFLGKHYDKLNFHSKSVTRQTIQKGFAESFTFQFSNKDQRGGRDAIFDKGQENDFCIFVYVPYDKVEIGRVDFYIRTIIPWLTIKECDLLEDPKNQWLIGTKLCVYTNTIGRFMNGQLVEA